MSDNHVDPPLTVRVPADLKDAALAELDQRGLAQGAFVVAALQALRTDPEATLRQLAAHWPPAKPRGRPRRERPDEQDR